MQTIIKSFRRNTALFPGNPSVPFQRSLLVLEEQGAEKFFAEPALEIFDLIQTNSAGQGYINILAAEQLINYPSLYATFLLWLLSELFEELPEVGDLEKPKMIFFFDEAHLLFIGVLPGQRGKA